MVAAVSTPYVGRLDGKLTLIGSAANETNGIVVRELGLDAAWTSRWSRPWTRWACSAPVIARLRDWMFDPVSTASSRALLALLRLERGGVRVLNRVAALLGAHDKLRTTRLLAAAGRCPMRAARTCLLRATLRTSSCLPGSKPRFGSWGRDVFRCNEGEELERTFIVVRDRPWFRLDGELSHRSCFRFRGATCGSSLRAVR